MVEIFITHEMQMIAKKKAAKLGVLHDSIRNGGGNIVGFLGELITQKIWGGEIINTYDFDILLPWGETVDVKTKETTVIPKSHYSCSVPLFNTRQKCDFYAFARIKNDLSIGWFLGLYRKMDFLNDAKLIKKGELEPSNGFIEKSGCYSLPISQLKDFFY